MTELRGKDLKDYWKDFTVSNSEPSFYLIYSHYYSYLTFIGGKRNFPEDKIKDSISDIFLYLWENRAELQNISNYHNYIITSFLRKLYRKNNFLLEEMPELEELNALFSSPSVEDTYMNRDMDQSVTCIVEEMINQLADKQRHLIYQKFYLGLSYQEIAEANNISINTVYNTIYKATNKLKTMITKEQETFLSLAFSLSLISFLFFFQ